MADLWNRSSLVLEPDCFLKRMPRDDSVSGNQPPFAFLLDGATVADLVDAAEGGHDFFVVSDDDDGGLELADLVIL